MIDFHTHLLPGLDDGAADMEITRQLLNTYNRGDIIAATPHFYPAEETIENFLKRREKALFEIQPELNGKELLAGAEVHLSPEITAMDGIERMAIGNTGCILLELPYEPVPSWIEAFLFSLIAKKKLIPVLAHAERYFPAYNNIKELEKLLKMDVYVQVNAGSVLSDKRKKAVRLLQERGMIHVLGSDCHNMNSRPNRMAQAHTEIRKSWETACLRQLEDNAAQLINGKKPEKHILPPKKNLFSFWKK